MTSPRTGESVGHWLEREVAALPVVRHLGLQVGVGEEGPIECRLERIGPEHLGGLETRALNGGILLAMLDAVTVIQGLRRFPRHRCATVDLRATFRHPVVPEGAIARGFLVRIAGRVLIVRGEVRDQSDRLCVEARGVVKRLGPRTEDSIGA